MRKLLVITIVLITSLSTYGQENTEAMTILDTVTIDLGICYQNLADTTDDFLNDLILKECLEEATEKHLSGILAYYKIESFEELNLKNYLLDLKPKLIDAKIITPSFYELTFKEVLK